MAAAIAPLILVLAGCIHGGASEVNRAVEHEYLKRSAEADVEAECSRIDRRGAAESWICDIWINRPTYYDTCLVAVTRFQAGNVAARLTSCDIAE